jgi:DNA-binding SARP family transcriptional activator
MRGKAIGRSLPVHHLHLMGAFTLQVDGTRIHLGRREERLLAFLAMHGPCHRPFVAGSLWPNSDEARALSNLRAAVLKVRQAAREVLDVDGSTLSLSPSVVVDLVELVQSVEQVVHHETLDGERAEHLLGTGVLLPGWYDDWVMFERERLHHRRVRALEVLAVQELETGHADLALAAARDAVALEPLRESAHRLLIRAHLALGNRALAVTVLAHYQRDLARDLHIEPSPELLQEVREGLGRAPQPTARATAQRDSRT